MFWFTDIRRLQLFIPACRHSYYGHVIASHMNRLFCFYAMWTIQKEIFTTNYAFRGFVLILGQQYTNFISNDTITAQYWLICQAKFDNKLLCMNVMITVLRWWVGGGAYSI